MTLIEVINFKKAYRQNRLMAAQWVLAHPQHFKELLEIGLKNDPALSHRANWVLEFVCLKKLALLLPNLDYFFEHLPFVNGDASVRPLSHICEILCIKYFKENDTLITPFFTTKHKETLIEVCFNWLLTPQKVACEVRAITCLYYLGTAYPWIHPELKSIIGKNISIKSAGYKSRGLKILDKLK